MKNNLLKAATSQVGSGRSNIPKEVRNYICSLTSLYMAIKFLALENGFNYPKFSEFIAQGIAQTKINCTYGYLEFKFGSKILKVPLYYSKNENKEKIHSKSILITKDLDTNIKNLHEKVKVKIPKTNSKRVRGFSISTGWDTGGSKQLIKKFGLDAFVEISVKSKFMTEFQNTCESCKLQKLKDNLTDSIKNNIDAKGRIKSVTCVSINTNAKQWKKYYRDYMPNNKYTNHTVKTHVVLAVCIINDEIIFMDPAGKNKKEIIQKMDLEDFLSSYNGIHTNIKFKPSF